MKSNIQRRLFLSFTAVIILVVILMEIFVIFGISEIFNQNMERIMADNLDYAINSIVYRSDSLEINEILDPSFRQFFDNDQAQVQIIDRNGMVVFDSLGVLYTEEIIYPDITEAKSGYRGVWRGSVDYSDENVMAMSTPINNSTNQNIGILRMVISTGKLDSLVIKAVSLFVFIGLLIIGVALLISMYFAKGIVEPLKDVSDVAMKIADGQLDVRSNVKTNDEIEQVSDSINHMADELIKRDQLKNDFISSVSHELRTPLTSIKGWAITIQSAGDMSKELRDEGLDIIVNETDRLSDMVEELLDFSRYTSGQVTLQKEKIDLESFLDDVVRQMKARILKEGHVFTVDLADNLGNLIVDKDRIRQVLINVFDNAIKFTEEPGQIALYARRNSLNQALISVRDSGIGIGPEDIKRVKEKFYKGSLGKSHTGLGLSISDEIIRLHGGELLIESEINQGTTITLVLNGISKEE